MANKLCLGSPLTGYYSDLRLHWMGRVVQVPNDATSSLARQKLLPGMIPLSTLGIGP